MAGFFSRPQKTIFKVDYYDYIEAIDLTNGFKIKEFLSNYGGISYNLYTIQDGERPDNVAQKIYDSPYLDWTILLANNIHSIYDEWPRDSQSFKRYMIDKFGSIETALATIKYYYDGSGNIINATDYNALSANSGKRTETEYQYEYRANINKSRIKVFKPQIARTMASSLRNIDRKPLL